MSDQLPSDISAQDPEPSQTTPGHDATGEHFPKPQEGLCGPQGSSLDLGEGNDSPKKPKSHAGRKLVFQTDPELRAAIQKYFDEEKASGFAPTMSGLAVSIGINRASIMNYSRRAQFFDTISWARDVVEAATEKCLQKSGLANGMIFSLINNFSESSGWKSKQEQDLNIGGQANNPVKIEFTLVKPNESNKNQG